MIYSHSQVDIAIFKNNEKYTIIIYKDENNNGTINSSDIFELLNKNSIDKNSIIEISNFIIKKEEFENYSIKIIKKKIKKKK